jgi:alpha-mannosidase
MSSCVTDIEPDRSHIDTAWLWRFTHTRQKIARSWSTQLDLFDRYPSHQFSASSAQQFFWLEQYYPELFLRVQKAVKADRFIPVGGSWLEHDCVLPSGEALIRQYLYGQRYFQEKFGITSREAWLPDTFGYAPQLPQILRLAGIKFFFTQKVVQSTSQPLVELRRLTLVSCHGTISTSSRIRLSTGRASTPRKCSRI